MTKITNAEFDVEAAAVAGPYGPLVRVTDADADHPDPNQDIQVVFDTAISGVQVSMTWEQITNDAVRDAIIAQAFNFQTKLEEAKDLINTLDTDITAMSLPHTYADFKTIYGQVLVLAQTIGVINW